MNHQDRLSSTKWALFADREKSRVRNGAAYKWPKINGFSWRYFTLHIMFIITLITGRGPPCRVWLNIHCSPSSHARSVFSQDSRIVRGTQLRYKRKLRSLKGNFHSRTFFQASKHLVKRYLAPQNIFQTPSQQVFGRPGYSLQDVRSTNPLWNSEMNSSRSKKLQGPKCFNGILKSTDFKENDLKPNLFPFVWVFIV